MYPVIPTIALFFIFFQIQDPIQSRTVSHFDVNVISLALLWSGAVPQAFFFFLLWHCHFWRLQASCFVGYFGLGLFNSLFMIQFKLNVLAKNNSEMMLCPWCITSRGTCCQFLSFFADWVKGCVCVLNLYRLFVTSWAVTRQAPLSMEFLRQEYWSGLSCPPPGDLSDPRIEAASLVSPILACVFFTTAPPGKSLC